MKLLISLAVFLALQLVLGPLEASAANYCGETWYDATSCDYGACPNGTNVECPAGTFCFSGVACSNEDKFPESLSEGRFVRDCVGREDEKLAVLTFDDGPWYYTSQYLDILKEKNATATFFVTGSNFENQPELEACFEENLRRIVREGHVLANHGMSNNEFTLEEVNDCHDEISRRTNGYEMQYFRPAQGLYTKDTYTELTETTDYWFILWNLDTSDWLPGRDPNEVLALVRTAVTNPTTPTTDDLYNSPEYPRRGSFIILAHDFQATLLQEVDGGVVLLAAVIDTIHDAGYRIVSLDECLSVDSATFDLEALGDDTGKACDNNITATNATSDANYCGVTWINATSCNYGTCPNGLDSECPDGMKCFADVECSNVEPREDTSNFCGFTWTNATRCESGSCPSGLDFECSDGIFCFADIECPTSGVFAFFHVGVSFQIVTGLVLCMRFLGIYDVLNC